MGIDDIHNRIFGENQKITLEESLYIVMRKFGYTIQEMRGEKIVEEHCLRVFGKKICSWTKLVHREGMPITTLQFLMKFIKKESDQMKKDMEKSKRK